MTVGRDLVGHPRVRNDRETKVDKCPRVMRKRTHPGITLLPGCFDEVGQEPRPEPVAPIVVSDHQGSDFGKPWTETRKLRARHDSLLPDGNVEPRDVKDDLAQRAWQEMTRLKVVGDQAEQGQALRRPRQL